MSDLIGEKVGQTVGYRVRLDSRVSPATRIEVVTEGVLTRRLQSDPSLEGIGLVIFDEFHERSLDSDLGLALCLDMQGVLNPDLRLLIMSATIDAGPIAALVGNTPVLTSAGREFPVETRYVGRHTPTASIDILCDAVVPIWSQPRRWRPRNSSSQPSWMANAVRHEFSGPRLIAWTFFRNSSPISCGGRKQWTGTPTAWRLP
jgi:HrpA-like RNA helicase